jgi:homoserine kinase
MSAEPLLSVRAFAPASVSNVACGFDIFGFSIERPGDEVIASQGPAAGGVEITEIRGDDGRLPRETHKNTAGVAVQTLLESTGCTRGVRLVLEKHMPLSSGLGSSAASGVAAVVAVNRLLRLEASQDLLLRCAMEGERIACGSAHADNAAPCLYGGFVLIRQSDPPEVISLPVPADLTCAVVRPHVEVETRTARKLLGNEVPLKAAVRQWGNVAALVTAFFRNDFELLARSMEDTIAEPIRAPLVQGYEATKATALSSGAIGCNLSGSGPSIFAFCRGLDAAEFTADAMMEALAAEGLEADRMVSEVGAQGARVLTA